MHHYSWDFAALGPYLPLFWRGAKVTLFFTFSTVIVGLVVGLLAGLLRSLAPRWAAIPARIYIDIFRCTPLLVQIVWGFYALPVLTGVNLSAGVACFITLSLYAGSFYAEVFRAGIEAIDRGQWEAGQAIGMHRRKVFRRIILPQAVRIMLPAFINNTVMNLKNTSLVSTVTVGDLLYQGQVISATTFRPLEAYTTVAVIYFAMLFPLTLLSDRLEKHMGVHR